METQEKKEATVETVIIPDMPSGIIDGINTGMAQIQSEIAPDPEISIPIEYVYDSEHPLRDRGIVKETDGEKALTFYLSEGVSVTEVKTKRLHQYLEQDKTEIPINQVLSLSHNSNAQRTCIFFSPPEEHAEVHHSIESKHYTFDKLHSSLGICSSKDMIKKYKMTLLACQSIELMTRCPFFQAEPWELIRQVDGTLQDNSVISLCIRVTRLGFGVPTYRILKGDEVLETISAAEHKENTLGILDGLFGEHLAACAFSSTTEVDIPEVTEIMERYFDYVLQP